VKGGGQFEVQFGPKAEDTAGEPATFISWNYEVTAEVTDEGGETRSATKSTRIGFVSVEARFQFYGGFVREGAASSVKLYRTDLDGVPRAGKASWKIVALNGPKEAISPVDEVTEAPPNKPSGMTPVVA